MSDIINPTPITESTMRLQRRVGIGAYRRPMYVTWSKWNIGEARELSVSLSGLIASETYQVSIENGQLVLKQDE